MIASIIDLIASISTAYDIQQSNPRDPMQAAAWDGGYAAFIDSSKYIRENHKEWTAVSKAAMIEYFAARVWLSKGLERVSSDDHDPEGIGYHDAQNAVFQEVSAILVAIPVY